MVQAKLINIMNNWKKQTGKINVVSLKISQNDAMQRMREGWGGISFITIYKNRNILTFLF